LLKSEYIDLQKIAKTLMESSSGGSSKSSNSSYGLGGRDRLFSGRRVDGISLQNTLHKSREKADLQPLHSETNIVAKPFDAPTAVKFSNKQGTLGHIEDKRITNHHNRRR